MNAPRVVCVGEGLVVLVARPGPLECSDTFDRSAGGAEANVAHVLHQLGLRTSWISRVGDDGFGRYVVDQLTARGVDTSGVTIDPSRPTGMYVKERGAGTTAPHDLPIGDSRMSYFRSGSAASALTPRDVDTPLVASADMVHFSGITVALSASAEATTRSLLSGPTAVSFDLNFRPALWGDRIDSAPDVLADHVRGSDVVLMGSDEADVVFGTGDPDALRDMFLEPRHLVIKNDAHTVSGFDGTRRVDVPALRLNVVEKIGAGDAFAGGYLAGLLRGDGLRKSLRLGHLCAAGALTAHGDIAHLLPADRLVELIERGDEEWPTVDYAVESR